MDVLARLVAALVPGDAPRQAGPAAGLGAAVRAAVKEVAGGPEDWVAVQARRRREQQDPFRQHPGLDPVFMKV